MTATLTLTDAQVTVVASALFRQREHVCKLRADAEKRIADPGTTRIDWPASAAESERNLAAIEELVSNLPPWVAVFTAAMWAERTAA
jgi:hypothetical protein